MENIDKPRLRTDYVAQEVTPEWLKSIRKPPRYINFIPEPGSATMVLGATALGMMRRRQRVA